MDNIPADKPALTWGPELWRLYDSFENPTDKPKFATIVTDYFFHDILPQLADESPELRYAFRVAQLLFIDQNDGAVKPPTRKRDFTTPPSLPPAVARACRRRGKAEWMQCVTKLLSSLHAQGVDMDKVQISDGWGEEDDYPYFWDGHGEFTIWYNGESQDDGKRATDDIGAVLGELTRTDVLTIDSHGTDGVSVPWWYVKSRNTD